MLLLLGSLLIFDQLGMAQAPKAPSLKREAQSEQAARTPELIALAREVIADVNQWSHFEFFLEEGSHSIACRHCEKVGRKWWVTVPSVFNKSEGKGKRNFANNLHTHMVIYPTMLSLLESIRDYVIFILDESYVSCGGPPARRKDAECVCARIRHCARENFQSSLLAMRKRTLSWNV